MSSIASPVDFATFVSKVFATAAVAAAGVVAGTMIADLPRPVAPWALRGIEASSSRPRRPCDNLVHPFKVMTLNCA